ARKDRLTGRKSPQDPGGLSRSRPGQVAPGPARIDFPDFSLASGNVIGTAGRGDESGLPHRSPPSTPLCPSPSEAPPPTRSSGDDPARRAPGALRLPPSRTHGVARPAELPS